MYHNLMYHSLHRRTGQGKQGEQLLPPLPQKKEDGNITLLFGQQILNDSGQKNYITWQDHLGRNHGHHCSQNGNTCTLPLLEFLT